MKTSQHQFDLLITFMEEQGDLSKPMASAKGRRLAMDHWDNLTSLLNSDGSGDTKTTEKWKKVWSDFKNNLKKKAARLHRAATGTGGGPAVFEKLSDLERRVLRLIGLQTATGLAITEAGLTQDIVTVEIIETANQEPQSSQFSERLHLSNVPGPSCQTQVEPGLPFLEPGPSTCIPLDSPNIVNLQEERLQNIRDCHTPTLQESNVAAPPARVQPALYGQTTPRHSEMASQVQPSPRRRVGRKRNIDQAAEQFQRSDDEWRAFRMQQHKDYMEMKREKTRIRELELQMQREWHSLAERTIDLVDKVVNKFCKD